MRYQNYVTFGRRLIVFLVIGMIISPCAYADIDGLKFKTATLQPGKIDFNYRLNDSSNDYNLIWWSPVVKGGAGVQDFNSKNSTDYVGVFIRPLQSNPELGDLIVGFHHVGTAIADDHEVQAEYRFPFGFGFGGGFVERSAGAEVRFGKISYRNRLDNWNYIVSVQGQEEINRTKPGGYLALYDDQIMTVAGFDGEQWRTSLGYVTPKSDSRFKPAAEMLYVDSSGGGIAGTRFLFINATLKYQGGFLSHAARLGRAMGPTGVEYGNPLGFLRPTWNRRLDVWELGGLADFRLVRTRSTTGVTTGTYEAVTFPFQFDEEKNYLDYLFIGGFYSATPGKNSPGIATGVFGNLGFLQVSIKIDYNFDTDEKLIVIGIVDKF